MIIIVAIDSMKGVASSEHASASFASGIRYTQQYTSVFSFAVADGGEGTARCLASHSRDFQREESTVIGPEGFPVKAEWWRHSTGMVAYIDLASAAGLPLVASGRRNPMRTTTYGVGQLLAEAHHRYGRKIILGLGGSATVDGGLGALQAMGAVILDRRGIPMPIPFTGSMLTDVGDIELNGITERWKATELTLACDVTTRYTGAEGAAYIFGAQKGANEEETRILDVGLYNLKSILLKKTGIDLDTIDGSGAAGGVGGGLMAALGGKIVSGSEMMLDFMNFEDWLTHAGMVVTGEGCADRQTLMNKIPGAILKKCRQLGVPAIIVAGRIEDEEKLKEAGFSKIIDINSPEIVKISGTEGCNPMDREVALSRLRAAGQLLATQLNSAEDRI